MQIRGTGDAGAPGRSVVRAAACAIGALLLGAGGCSRPTMLETATASSPGKSVRALVLGRLQVTVAGQPVRVGPAGPPPQGSAQWEGAEAPLLGEETDTMILFERLRTGELFGYDLPDDTGRFEVLLPPGRYGVKLRYEKYLVATPARFEATEAGQQYYIGTLQAQLFRRGSVLGWRARIFGGNIPSSQRDFRVIDEWDWAKDNLRAFRQRPVRAEKHLMSLRSS
jgi:hypothetical protein